MQLKQLELWWRRQWISLLVRLMRQPTDGARPDWASRPHRVLFLRHDRAGDMIVSTGVMRAIARSHPTIQLDILASPANADVIAGASYVNDVVLFQRNHWRQYPATIRRLRRAKYDAVIDCMVTAPSVTTLLLMLASGARYRVGIAGRGNDAAFNITVPSNERPGAHMVDLLAALAAAFDVDSSTVERRPTIELTRTELDRAERAWGTASSRRVLVNISAGKLFRRWPEAGYEAVIARVFERDPTATVRLISAPNERERAEGIASRAGALRVDTPSIRDAFALVATADLLIGPDTSIGHAASAFGTPAVLMYIAGVSERWGLYQTPGVSIQHDEKTLEHLAPARVLAAVDELLDRPVERPAIRNAALRESR